MIVSSSEISLRGAKLEGAVVQCIKDWATANPADLVAFDQQQKMERKEVHRQGGMSREGNLQKFGSVPTKLYRMMQFRFDRHWMSDPTIRNLFWSHFTVGKIDRYAEMGKR